MSYYDEHKPRFWANRTELASMLARRIVSDAAGGSLRDKEPMGDTKTPPKAEGPQSRPQGRWGYDANGSWVWG